jgi:hypothetical protein
MDKIEKEIKDWIEKFERVGIVLARNKDWQALAHQVVMLGVAVPQYEPFDVPDWMSEDDINYLRAEVYQRLARWRAIVPVRRVLEEDLLVCGELPGYGKIGRKLYMRGLVEHFLLGRVYPADLRITGTRCTHAQLWWECKPRWFCEECS